MSKPNTYHVVYLRKQGWAVQDEHSSEILCMYPTQREAEAQALALGYSRSVEFVMVHFRDGRIRELYGLVESAQGLASEQDRRRLKDTRTRTRTRNRNTRVPPTFEQDLEYVLKKNAGLYTRLAK